MSKQELLQELENVKHDSLFAECIKSNPASSIDMIRDQIKDNRVLCVEIIGESLVTVIEQL